MRGHFFRFQVKLLSCTIDTPGLALIHGLTNSHSTSFKSEGGQCVLLLFCDVGASFLLFKISSPKVWRAEAQAIYFSNSVKFSNLPSMLVKKKKKRHES